MIDPKEYPYQTDITGFEKVGDFYAPEVKKGVPAYDSTGVKVGLIVGITPEDGFPIVYTNEMLK